MRRTSDELQARRGRSFEKEHNEVSEVRIRLNADGVIDFVKAATECDFDIDVHCRRVHVDGKSILGMMSMDLSHILVVKYYGHSQKFEQLLARYAEA